MRPGLFFSMKPTALGRTALLLCLLMPGYAFAQEADVEQAPPPSGFFTQLGRNLFEDVKHLPRRNSVYWWAAGGALALAVHPQDHAINGRLHGTDAGRFFAPGKHLGSTAVLLGTSAATYAVGSATKSAKLRHLGMDGIEAVILVEGITQGLKLAVQRQRPDGSRGTYSFPSGHATLTFATATVLQQHLGYKAAIPTYLLATYVAMSRLHDNRHFASDVIFGAANGIVIGRAVTWHGRNYYATPMAIPGEAAMTIAWR